MKIKDEIYGEFEIDGVVEELINTKEFQRLKNIHQGGAWYLINPNWNVNIYEHSIGTMIFIKMMNRTIEEQIAVLLNDIYSCAFSSINNLLLNEDDNKYIKTLFDRVIESSNIPKILDKYGYDYKEILNNKEKSSLLSKDIPFLNPRLIDYIIRNMHSCGYISPVAVKNFLESLQIVGEEIVINSINAAEWFVNTYNKEIIGLRLNSLNIYANDRFSKAIRLALENNIISLDNLIKDDNYILNILKNCNDERVKKIMSSLNYDINVSENKENYDMHKVEDIRVIDPIVIIDGVISKASEKSILIKILNEQLLQKLK